MPEKLERCVKSVMEKQGVSESRAFAICNTAMDSAKAGILRDRGFGITNAVFDEISGFLTAPVTLARTGIQEYFGFEIDSELDPNKVYKVFRPASEVFDESSVDSFVNLVSTDDHPSTPVDLSNVKDLQVGTVSGVEAFKDEGTLKGTLTITDAGTIDKIKNGKVEVSVGYAYKLKEEKGNYNGIDYDFVQTKIRANHLAIVDAGRCGSACKITIDNKKESPVKKITIDGIDYEVEDQVAQAIQKQQAAHDADVGELKKEKEKAEKDRDEMEKKMEKAEAAKDALIADSDKFSDDAIAKMVTDKALLLENARTILGDDMPECLTCDKEIKAAVIEKVQGLDVAGKSEAYIDAAYDIAIDTAKKSKGSLDDLQSDFNNDSVKTSREEAQAQYVKDHLGQGGN